MAPLIEQRLKNLGFELPEPSPALASYVPFVVIGRFVYISGQLPFLNGTIHSTGRIGQDVEIAMAQESAQYCCLNLLAQLKLACSNDWSRVQRCVRLGVFVNSGEGFSQHSLIGNGASDLMVAVFGESGRHVRSSIGCSSLPLNSSVEVEGLFEIKR